MSKVVGMKKACPNCETPKAHGELCEECGFWEPHDLEVNPVLKADIERRLNEETQTTQ